MPMRKRRHKGSSVSNFAILLVFFWCHDGSERVNGEKRRLSLTGGIASRSWVLLHVNTTARVIKKKSCLERPWSEIRLHKTEKTFRKTVSQKGILAWSRVYLHANASDRSW